MLARLVPLNEMEDKWETFTLKELLEMGLNCVHEATHSLYIRKERKKSLTRGHVEDIGSTVGIQSYP